MANELSRKGIAFGAAVALGSTLIAGGVANAAPNANFQDLTLTAPEGNGVLATTTDDYFGLVLGWNGNVNTENFDDLAYEVSITDADQEDGEGYGWFGSSYGSYDQIEDNADADSYWYEISGDTFASPYWFDEDSEDFNTFAAPHAGYDSSDDVAWDITREGGYEDDYGSEDLSVDFSEYDAPYVEFGIYDTPDYKQTVTVQAYLDTNHNGVIDGTETHSAAVSVDFFNPTALTPILALEDDGRIWTTSDNGSIGYAVTFEEKLNDYYTEDAYNADVFYNDSDEDYYVVLEVDESSNDQDELDFYWDNTESNVEDGTLGANDEDSLDWDYSNGEDNRVAVFYDGTRVTDWQDLIFDAPTWDDTYGEVVEKDFVAADYEDAIIRSDVKTVDYNVSLVDADNDPIVDNEVVVYSYFYGDEKDLDAYGVTIDGAEAIETASGSDVWEWATEGTTDSDGAITLNIAVTNPDDEFYLYVYEVEAQGTNDYIDGDLYWNNDAFEVEFQSLMNEDSDITALIGSDVEFDVYVKDAWAGANTDEVRVVVFNDDSRGTWVQDEFEVVDGVATVSISDTKVAGKAEIVQYSIAVQVRERSGWAFADYWYGDSVIDVEWFAADKATVNAVTAVWDNKDNKAEVNYADFFNANTFLDEDLAAALNMESTTEDTGDLRSDIYHDAGDDFAVLKGRVTASSGYGVAGAEVTISGTGLQFDEYWTDGHLFEQNSIVVRTDNDGYYAVAIAGHIVDEHAVTVSVGGKSTSATFEVTDDEIYASKVEVTSTVIGKAGTSNPMHAKVTDKFGNLAPWTQVTWTVSGAGFMHDKYSSTGYNPDNADYGVAQSDLVIGSNEAGYTSTVTATIGVLDPFEVAKETTASSSLGSDANAENGAVATWSKDLGDGTLKLYAKNVIGVGKVQFLHNGKEIAWVRALDSTNPKLLQSAAGSFYLVRTVKLVAGKNVFEIFVDGERTLRRVASK